MMSAVVIVRYEQRGELTLRRKLQDAGGEKKKKGNSNSAP